MSQKVSLAGIAVLGLAAACAESPSSPTPPRNLEPSFAAAQAGEAEYIPGQYIVVFRDGVPDVPGLARRLAAQHGGALRYTYTRALRGFAARLPGQSAAALARNPSVAYVEQDQVMRAVETQTGATWGIDRIDARFNDPSTPEDERLNGTYSYTNTASGVTAYVIDTGIDYGHGEFGGRARFGFDAFTDGRNGDDCHGHGTHVAGTVGGTTYGVAKSVSLVAVRVLSCSGRGTTSGVIAGVDFVTSEKKANPSVPMVANMSLGGGASGSLDRAVKNSIAAGVSYAIAAGNGSWGVEQDACRYSPARVTEAMTVGATDDTDRKASWSNYGKCVDWFAPGVGIASAWIGSGNTETRAISGTSMATPHTAGVAALYLQSNPGATPQQVRDALYGNTTKGIVTNSRTANNHLLYTNY